jgi:hypothetical protein
MKKSLDRDLRVTSDPNDGLVIKRPFWTLISLRWRRRLIVDA